MSSFRTRPMLPAAEGQPLRRLLCQLRYTPVHYWNTRRDPNNAEGREFEVIQRHIDFIKRHLPNSGPFLEFGPGVGRTFPAYKPASRVDSLDLSRLYQDALQQKASSCGVHLSQHFLNDAHSPFPFPDNTFTCAVVCQVLLHITPDSIVHVLSELMRVARKAIIITAAKTTARFALRSRHCFSHDYLSLFSDAGAVLHNARRVESTLFFTAEKALT